MLWESIPSADSKFGRKASLQDAAKRLAQLRWLIIDEISMINASFLAQIDLHLRSTRSNSWRTKKHNLNATRSFGGINVIVCGDFWQLDRPTGTSLASIPTEYLQKARKFVPSATTVHGQSLLWGFREHAGAVQGMTDRKSLMSRRVARCSAR